MVEFEFETFLKMKIVYFFEYVYALHRRLMCVHSVGDYLMGVNMENPVLRMEDSVMVAVQRQADVQYNKQPVQVALSHNSRSSNEDEAAVSRFDDYLLIIVDWDWDNNSL